MRWILSHSRTRFRVCQTHRRLFPQCCKFKINKFTVFKILPNIGRPAIEYTGRKNETDSRKGIEIFIDYLF